MVFKNIAIVNNSLQLLNLIECIEANQLTSILLIVPPMNIMKSKKIFLNTLEENRRYFSDIYFIEKTPLLFQYIEYFKIIKNFKGHSFDNFIFGNIGKIHSFLLGNIVANKYILIDEGFLSITLFKKLQKPFNLLSWKYKLLGLNTIWNKKIIFFTIFSFPLKGDNIIQNPLNVFKSTSKIQRISENVIFIIGQDVLRASILEEDNYREIIETIIKSNVQMDIFYFPHPGEKDLSLHYELEKQYLSYQVRQINESFETYFFNLEFKPFKIYSLFSTSLYILSTYFNSLQFISIVLKESEIKNRHAAIKNAYEFIINSKSIDKEYRR